MQFGDCVSNMEYLTKGNFPAIFLQAIQFTYGLTDLLEND